MKAKRHKMERQEAKRVAEDLTDQLDAQLDGIRSLLMARSNAAEKAQVGRVLQRSPLVVSAYMRHCRKSWSSSKESRASKPATTTTCSCVSWRSKARATPPTASRLALQKEERNKKRKKEEEKRADKKRRR